MNKVTTTFISDNFLLHNRYAEALYHTYAADQPIIDYHCHLSPEKISEDHIFENLAQAWLYGDHYKWRAMRTLGIDEHFITGNASDEEKFMAWAKTVPHTLRNPLYHWTHLELLRYFDIDELLNGDSAAEIYADATAKINSSNFSCQNLLTKMKVEVVCTTDDPVDTLWHHRKYENQSHQVRMGMAFRPDKAIMINSPGFMGYLGQLSEVSAIEIASVKTLFEALERRIRFFHDNGCRLSDHGLNYVPFKEASASELEAIFERRSKGLDISLEEQEKFETAVLLFLCGQYHANGWVQQFHLGALRNNNTRMNRILGPDTGWDSIGDFKQAETLSRFFDALDTKNQLAKTIVYNLNPADNELMASMIGNFNDGSVRGKMQLGSGWWFLDQKEGIIQQLNALSNMGMLSCFVGMLTDSRSFLSFPRHEYFRRVLCNLLGTEIQQGELPNDMPLIGQMVQNICYGNAKDYFDF